MRLTLHQLTTMRLGGKRPDGWVLVSLIGHLGSDPDPVIALTERPDRVDFRPLIDLPVLVIYRSDTQHEAVMETLNGIIRIIPSHLASWMTDRSIGYDIVECSERVFRRMDTRREVEFERAMEASSAAH